MNITPSGKLYSGYNADVKVEIRNEEKDSEFYKTALNVVKEKYLYNYVKENLTKSIKIASAQTDAFCNENRDKYRRNLEYIQGKAYYFDTTEEAQNYAQTGEGTENAV